jgi:hypothetical protein
MEVTHAWKRRLWLAAPAASALLFMALALGRGESRDGRIVLWSGWFVAGGLLVASGWWALLVGRCPPARHVVERAPAILSAWCILGSCAGTMPAWFGWKEYGALVAPDGATYVQLGRGFLDSDWALARRSVNLGFVATYDVLASTRNDHGAGPRLVRPLGTAVDRLVARGDCVALFWSEGGALVASTAASLRPSPFALVGPDDDIDAPSVDSLAEEISESRAPDDLPTDESLVEALASPNPHIRDAAARLVHAGGATTYPEATKQMEHAPR